MTETNLPLQSSADKPVKTTTPGTLSRVAKYTIVKAFLLFITVTVAVYLTILIANMGGYVDELVKARIDLALGGQLRAGWLRDEEPEEKAEIFEQTRQAMYEAEGLNEPFLLRSVRWLRLGLLLDWGESTTWSRTIRGRATSEVRELILDALPRTLLIFGTANLCLFFTTVFLALTLVRKHGSWQDRFVTGLSPLSAAPAWAYGIILNIIFLKVLGGLSTGGTFDAWPDELTLAYIPMVLKYMLLPFLAIFLSGFFQSVYAWRAFFLLYSTEDHVEMAKARGLSARAVERWYILRPGLPAVLTSFALMLVVLWQEVIALEKFFNVSGIGRLFYAAIRGPDMPIILGLVVSFAYLLAITVFALDIVYALVDPRVRIGSEGRTARPASRRGGIRFRLWRGRKPPSVRKPRWNPHFDPLHAISTGVKAAWEGLTGTLQRSASGLKAVLVEMARYPAAVIGLAIIVAMVCASIATVIVLPQDQAIRLWRGDDNVWYRNPTKAPPAWINLFRKEDLPSTIVLDSRGKYFAPGGAPRKGGAVGKSVAVVSEVMSEISLSFAFDYPYGAFPQDLVVYFDASYDEKKPLLTLTWLTPDGREIELGSFTASASKAYHLSHDTALQRKLGAEYPQRALFADPNSDEAVALPGTYELRVSAFVFEEDADLDAELVVHGQVHGLAGTDHQRRDLMVGLLWGTPVALAFGLLAAVGTSISTIVIAATSVWYGGWVDNLIQRITEVNLILPFLPVSIMIYILYSKSFWAILGVTVLLSIFGAGIKNYRAIFLQFKDAPYTEAALAYGASNWRIIFRYMVPRIGAIMIPQLVILIPSYVFLEATLAFLEVSDPVLPTWGKLIMDALSHGTYSGDYHMVLQPAALLMLTGFIFTMVGLSLERVFEPRLRER